MRARGNLLCGCGIVFVVGLIFLGIGSYFLYRTWQAQSWSSTEGIIQSSTIERHSDKDGDSYSIELVYSYDVHERDYTGSRINFASTNYSDFDDAESHLVDYPIGGSVTVYYDPDDPSDSVLERKITLFVYIFVAVGGGLVLLAIVLGFFGILRLITGR